MSAITGGAGAASANAVLNNQANTYSTGAQDFTSATSFIAPASGGAAPTADASLAYDTTQDAWSAGGAGAVNGKIPRVLSAQQSTSDTLTASTISTTETQFTQTFQIPANYLIANKILRLSIILLETTSGTPATQRIRIRLGTVGIGGSTIFDTGVITPVASASGQGFGTSFWIAGTGAAGASVNVITGCEWFNINQFAVSNDTSQPVAVATNGALNINLTLQFGANTAGNNVTLAMFLVEELN